jgi:hypothetical protein
VKAVARYYEDQWPAYVSVSERRRKAEREAGKLRKKGSVLSPVVVEGRKIASTFWGKAWCDNLESYRDYENRLERGRSYVRNGFRLCKNPRPVFGRIFGSDGAVGLYSGRPQASTSPFSRSACYFPRGRRIGR